MKQNRFQRVLREGGVPAGHMIMEFGTRGIAKILEAAGLDFVVIDMEHTGFDTERIADLVAWLSLLRTTCVRRSRPAPIVAATTGKAVGCVTSSGPRIQTRPTRPTWLTTLS